MKTKEYTVTGMTCTNCANLIKSNLKKVPNIKKIKINVPLNYMKIEYQDLLYDEKIIDLVKKSGYQAEIKNSKKMIENPQNKMNLEIKILTIKFLLSFILTIPFWVSTILIWTHNYSSFSNFLANPIFQFLLTIIINLCVGIIFYKEFFIGFKSLRLNMATLVILGTLTANIFSIYHAFLNNWQTNFFNNKLYFNSANTILVLVYLGKIFEKIAERKMIKTLAELSTLLPEKIKIIVNNKQTHIKLINVKINDLVVIESQQIIPVDGIIVNNPTLISEAILTGESNAIVRKINDKVLAGSTNLGEKIIVKVTNTYQTSMIAQVVSTIKDAQLSETKLQQRIDKISMWFVPLILIIALITFIGWTIFDHNVSSRAVINAISVLIISCPCALGLAAPTAILVTSNNAAKNGVIFKGSDYLEKLAKVSTIVFDKTGTLTIGNAVNGWLKNVSLNYSDLQIKKFINAIALKSTHPIAKIIINSLKIKSLIVVSDFKETTSHGIQGIIDNKLIKIGKYEWISNNSSKTNLIKKWENENNKIITISINNEIVGYFIIKDEIKSSAYEAIKKLQDNHFHIVLLSGDNLKATKNVARALNITEYYANALINDKKKIIQRLQSKNCLVAMIGEGINDTLALTYADVGIALGTGPDLTINSANVVLINEELNNVYYAILLAKKTVKKIKTNLWWAFLYNIIAIPLACFGIVFPQISAAMMALSSIIIVSNSLLLKVKI